MVDEIDFQPLELQSPPRRESFHTEGLGGVVTGVNQIDSEFFRRGVTPVRSLSGDEGVDPGFRQLMDLRTRPPGDEADFFDVFRPPGAEERS